MTAHAILSPSSAHRWMRCVGAPAMEQGYKNNSSEYADEGTAAHFVAAQCLTHGTNAAILQGLNVEITDGEGAFLYNPQAFKGGRLQHITSEMVDYVQTYIDFVREQAADAKLLVEEELPIYQITGEESATGTGDAIILAGRILKVIDLKFGRGNMVEAEENEQLMMYALGALEKHDLVGEFEEVWMFIHQPRVSSEPSLYVLSVERLLQWKQHATAAAIKARFILDTGVSNVVASTDPVLVPGQYQCRFCKAKADCPALSSFVAEEVGADFETLSRQSEPVSVEYDHTLLSHKMSACDLIENWIKAVRVKVESELFAAHDVPDYKLVEGRRGARKWSDEEEAEKVLKSMRLKTEEMYDFKLISPTTAEKVLKESPKRWNRVTNLITQSEGKPSVAHASDKRPALVVAPVADDFAAHAEDLI